jgi:hypothetical protein
MSPPSPSAARSESGENASIEFAAAAECWTPNYAHTREHRAAITSRARVALRDAVSDIAAPQWQSFIITITRVGAGSLDGDNLVAACKPVRDELAAWIGIDDRSNRYAWEYEQRFEKVIDETPRAKRAYRTWVEVRLEPGPGSGTHPRGSFSAATRGGAGTDTPSDDVDPRGPPARLERERTHAPTREDQERTRPSADVLVATRSKGSSLRLARLDDVHGTRLRLAVHFVAQGHAWRTTGVAIEIGEIPALVAALGELAEAGQVVAPEPRRPVRASRARVVPRARKKKAPRGEEPEGLDCDATSEDSDDEP